jgi:hypothetical protein
VPEKKTVARARKAKREGKAPTTQAGEFVREEIEHVREGKHGVRSTKQAIAIGLAKARRAGVALPPRGASEAPTKTGRRRKPSARRSRATTKALGKGGKEAVSKKALAAQARAAAAKRRQGREAA